MEADLRVNFPGLLIERHRNGAPRVRVRVEGQPGKRVHIPVGPDDPQFAHYYHAARVAHQINEKYNEINADLSRNDFTAPHAGQWVIRDVSRRFWAPRRK